MCLAINVLGDGDGGRTYPCTSEGLAAAKADLSGAAASWKARVVLDEIVSNLVRESGATRMRVVYRREGEVERLVFADDGVPFNPLASVAPAADAGLEEREHGGVGLQIVRVWAKDLRYRRLGGDNELSVML